MGKWSITPNTADIDKNGKVTFHRNEGIENIEYTITYEDDEKKVICMKTVIQEGSGCYFNYDATTEQIPSGGEDDFVFGTFSEIKGKVLDTVTIDVYEGDDFVSNMRITDNKLVGTVSENVSGSRTIKYRIISKSGGICANETISQSKGCDCSNIILHLQDCIDTQNLLARCDDTIVTSFYANGWSSNSVTWNQLEGSDFCTFNQNEQPSDASKFSLTINSINRTGSQRIARFKVKVNDESIKSCNEWTVVLTQESCERPCDCRNISLTLLEN